MTDTNLQNKARAVVLSALMVLSVMVGTIALSGGAAAATGSIDLSDDLVQGGDQIKVSGDVDANGTVYAFIDTNGDGVYNTSEPDGVVNIQNHKEDSTYSITLNAPSGSGTYDVYVNQTEDVQDYPITEGDTGERSASLQVDADEPLFGDGHTRNVETTTPKITVPLTPVNGSVNASTIEVDFVSAGGESYIHQVNAPSSDSDGISYDADAGEVTIDLGSDGLKALEAGETYDVDVSAEDTVGNLNSTGFQVVVDTEKPTFTFDQPSADIVGEPTQTIKVSIPGGDINDSTVELTIEGPGGYSYTNNSSDTGVYDDSSDTFTVDAGENGDIPELPNGTITVSVTAADDHGLEASETFTFEVDNQQPHVDGVSVNETLYTDENSVAKVTVDFNESVAEGTVAATISAGTTTADLTFTQGDDGDDSMVYATYDLLTNDKFDNVENGSVKVLVTAGEDLYVNTANLDAGSNSTTFGIDTVEPTVTIDSSLPNVLEGGMDIGQYVSVSQANGNDARIGWMETSMTLTDEYKNVTWFDTAAFVDTRDITEGDITLVAVAYDENVTKGQDTLSVDVDNVDATVEAVTPSVLVEDNTEIPVSALVDVEDNGTEAVKQYGYTTPNTDWTWADDATITVDSDTTYTFGVRVNDPADGEQELYTNSVETGVFETGDLGITVENVDSKKFAGKVNITVTSEHELNNGTVLVETIDNYHKQSSKTLSFEVADKEGTNTAGEYVYTFQTNVDRDGQYEFSISNATTKTEIALTLSDTGVSDDLKVDEKKPELADADVTGATNEGHTKVKLTFDQPIDGLEASDISFGDASVNDLSADNGDGVFVVTFDREIQTGGDANLTISKNAYEEQITHNEISHPVEDDVMHVSSIELDLEKGPNFVSVPIEAGSIDIEGALCGCVNVIWTYEDGEWKSYDPDAKDNELTTFEGGQGYIIDAKDDTDLSLRGFTKYGAGSVGDENEPNSQAEQDLENGWNLIGHYQEGSQSVDQAFSPLPDGADWSVEDGTGDSVSVLESGEGYWLFTNVEYAKHVAVDYDGMQSEQATVANVEMTDGVEGDGVLVNGETVTISADVADDSIITSVTVSSDKLGIDDVELFDNGDGTYTGRATIDFGDVSPDEMYTLNVAAVDAEGNVGYGDGESLPVETTLTITSTTITDADGDGTVASGDDVTIEVTASDESGIDTVEADASNFGAGTVTLTDGDDNGVYDKTVTVGSSTDLNGEQDVSVTVTDNAGNTASDTSGTLTVDNGEPTSNIDSLSKSTVTGGASLDVTYDASDAESSVQSAELQFAVGDATDSVDKTVSITTFGSNKVKSVSAPSAAGTYDVTLVVTDAAGNTKTSAAKTLTVDTTGPTASITSPSDGDSVQSQTSITGTAGDNDAVASVDLTIENTAGDTWDGSAFTTTATTVSATYDSSAGTWSYDSSGITTEDTYTVTATATDEAGNTADSSTVSYTIDKTGPTASISSSSFDDSTDTYTVFVAANEELDTSTISVDVTDSGSNAVTTLTGFSATDDGDAGTAHSYTATYTVTSSVDTTYTSTLTATEDLAGNADASTNDDTSSAVTVDTTAPSKTTVEATAGDTVEVTYDESVSLTAGTPTSGFSVTVDGSAMTVSGASVTSGDTVELTLDSTYIDSDSTVDVSYDGSGNVKDDAGNAAGSFGATGVTVTAPDTAQFSTATTSSSTTVQVTLDESVTLSATTKTSGFTVTAGGSATTVTGATVTNGDTVELTLGSAISTGQTVTVSYDGSNGNLQDADGNLAIVFTGETVTNNV